MSKTKKRMQIVTIKGKTTDFEELDIVSGVNIYKNWSSSVRLVLEFEELILRVSAFTKG